jgi:galactose mutarotase-like enzyme
MPFSFNLGFHPCWTLVAEHSGRQRSNHVRAAQQMKQLGKNKTEGTSLKKLFRLG